MPRYFFHVLNSRAIVDTEGTEYPTLDAARRAAVRTAGQIIASEGETFWQEGAWRMAVADDSGKIVFTLDFIARSHDP